MFSRFFINRPIFASVLSIVIVLAGLAALRALPVEQYPQIVPAVVSVSANYPGATPQTIAETVAAPLSSSSTAWKTCSTCNPAPPPTASSA